VVCPNGTRPRDPLALHLALINRVLGGRGVRSTTSHGCRLSCGAISLCDLNRSAARGVSFPLLRGAPFHVLSQSESYLGVRRLVVAAFLRKACLASRRCSPSLAEKSGVKPPHSQIRSVNTLEKRWLCGGRGRGPAQQGKSAAAADRFRSHREIAPQERRQPCEVVLCTPRPPRTRFIKAR
jgi:hypothetical protein